MNTLSIQDLLIMMSEKKASDLHLTTGVSPMLRIDGEMVPTPFEKLTPDTCQRVIYSILTEAQKQKFEASGELDLSFSFKEVGRIRMNVFRPAGSVAAALRAISNTFMTFEELGLPQIVYDLMKLQKGLILVTGPTGSGKSTTLASMINYLNQERNGHIVTVEDPIEYVHYHNKCVVNQREVGADTQSFSSALKYALRQDPDIILIGEMRDLETIREALIIAETGHLVFGTLHTTDAAQSINRIVDVFPSHQQMQVRSQLSFVLQAIFSQMLLLKASGAGRLLASEVLIATPAVRNLIRDGKTEHIVSAIQTGGKFGMVTFNQSLLRLYDERMITFQQALENSPDPEELKKMLQKSVAGL